MSLGRRPRVTPDQVAAGELYNLQADIARKQWNEYREQGAPIMAQLSQEALEGPGAARYAERIGQAGADVRQSFAGQREMMDRSMRGMGVNPASGRFAGMDRSMRLAEAATEAGAMTSARRAVDDEAYGRRLNAVGLASGQGAQAQAGIASAAGGLASLGAAQQAAASSAQAGLGGIVGTGIMAGAVAF